MQKKIEEQSSHLFDRGFIEQSEMLKEYALQVCDNDYTNREGHAAKVYFNCLLGIGNSRQGGGFVNGCLNYGYSVLLSAFNREITASGYLTQLGIWHDNEFNSFNLSCDLMEPFRVVVDRTALKIKEKDKEFKKNWRIFSIIKRISAVKTRRLISQYVNMHEAFSRRWVKMMKINCFS